MITKALVCGLSPTRRTYTIRIPYLESAGQREVPLYEAILSSTPGIYNAIDVGDVVMVSFEDHRQGKPVIVGRLSTGGTEPRGFANFKDLAVENTAELPRGTTIGGFEAVTTETVPKSTSDLVNDSGFITAEDIPSVQVDVKTLDTTSASSITPQQSEAIGGLGSVSLHRVSKTGLFSDLIGRPDVNDATLTIKQNNATVGTFSANASSNATVNLTDTTYENRQAASGGTDVSLVTTGDKYAWDNKQTALTGGPTITLRNDGYIDTMFSVSNTQIDF